jgi:hypothetical protein
MITTTCIGLAYTRVLENFTVSTCLGLSHFCTAIISYFLLVMPITAGISNRFPSASRMLVILRWLKCMAVMSWSPIEAASPDGNASLATSKSPVGAAEQEL